MPKAHLQKEEATTRAPVLSCNQGKTGHPLWKGNLVVNEEQLQKHPWDQSTRTFPLYFSAVLLWDHFLCVCVCVFSWKYVLTFVLLCSDISSDAFFFCKRIALNFLFWWVSSLQEKNILPENRHNSWASYSG